MLESTALAPSISCISSSSFINLGFDQKLDPQLFLDLSVCYHLEKVRGVLRNLRSKFHVIWSSFGCVLVHSRSFFPSCANQPEVLVQSAGTGTGSAGTGTRSPTARFFIYSQPAVPYDYRHSRCGVFIYSQLAVPVL